VELGLRMWRSLGFILIFNIMYVTNPQAIDKSKLYVCNGIIANYLIYEKHLPLFSHDKSDGKWYFAKTELLNKAIEEMPFYYNLSKIIW
jgi:hypothetical protein